MPSLFVTYRDNGIQTRKLRGTFRGLGWDRRSQSFILVGDAGRIVKIRGDVLTTLESGTRKNLRAISLNPRSGATLIAGNEGTIIQLDEDGISGKMVVPTTENLRAIAWSPDGAAALIAGNRGTLMKYSNSSIDSVEGGTANLRRAAWRPDGSQALVASNCFAEEFIPSPNLFIFKAEEDTLDPVNEGRADLIGVDWNPDGRSALVVGYDVIWHNGYIGAFTGAEVSSVEFENKRVYPVAVSWNPSGRMAAVVTATAQLEMAKGTIHLWDGRSLNSIFTSPEFFFSSVTWNDRGTEMAALASSATRTFNC